MSIDRNLDHLFPDFRVRVERIIAEVSRYCKKHCPEYTPVLVEGFRPSKRQQELYTQGRTKPGKIVTQKDGVRSESPHQSALAADIAFRRSGTIRWDVPIELWNYFGHCARAESLDWGGDWKTLVDRPHIQWKSADRETYRKAGEWKKAVGLK